MATTFGFSDRQGPHQEAQKSITVTFPNDSFNETVLPSGVFAEKSGALFTFFFLEQQLLIVRPMLFLRFYRFSFRVIFCLIFQTHL
jgi:hypothetical protein